MVEQIKELFDAVNLNFETDEDMKVAVKEVRGELVELIQILKEEKDLKERKNACYDAMRNTFDCGKGEEKKFFNAKIKSHVDKIVKEIVDYKEYISSFDLTVTNALREIAKYSDTKED